MFHELFQGCGLAGPRRSHDVDGIYIPLHEVFSYVFGNVIVVGVNVFHDAGFYHMHSINLQVYRFYIKFLAYVRGRAVASAAGTGEGEFLSFKETAAAVAFHLGFTS